MLFVIDAIDEPMQAWTELARSAGVTCRMFRTLADALARAPRDRPTAIALRVESPEGFADARHVRVHPAFKECRLLLYSTGLDAALLERHRRLPTRADVYVSPPAPLEALSRALVELLGHGGDGACDDEEELWAAVPTLTEMANPLLSPPHLHAMREVIVLPPSTIGRSHRANGEPPRPPARSEITALHDQITALREARNAAIDDARALRAALDSAQARAHTLEIDLMAARQAEARALAKLEHVEREITSLRGALAGAEAQDRARERRIAELEAEHARIRACAEQAAKAVAQWGAQAQVLSHELAPFSAPSS